MKQLFKIISTQFIFLIIWFSLIRLIFFILYQDQFIDLNVESIVQSFLIGIRFDFSVICFYYGLLNLFLFMPFLHLYNNRYFLYFTSFIGIALLESIFLVQVIDLGYYRVIGRRISFELFTLEQDILSMLQLVSKEYFIYLFLYFLISIVIIFFWIKGWKKIINMSSQANKTKVSFFKLLPAGVFFFIIILIGARGGLQEKPLLEADAFKSPKLILGHLALNAPFTFSKQLILDHIELYNFIDKEQAQQSLVDLLQTNENQRFLDQQYPFLRERTAQKQDKKKYNVVLIIIESFAAHFLGPYNSKQQTVTPFFNQLSKKGMLFKNFHANGSRSVEGIASILLSLPAFPDFTYIESALQQNNSSSIAKILNKNGYHSIFINGSFYGSFGMHQLAQKNGFHSVYAQEDFKDYQKKSDSVWGIWDQYQYDKIIEIADQQNQPFFVTLFTTSSHEPYELPDQTFNVFKSSEEHYKHKNLLHYADWSLGQFFKNAQSKNWFKNTLFIITADHSYLGKTLYQRSHIPLLIYTPDKSVQETVNEIIGSQIDIMPTIIDFLDLKTTHGSTGKSILTKSKTNFAYYSSGQLTWYYEEYAFVFNKNKLLAIYNFKNDKGFKNPLKENEIKNSQKIKTAFLAWLQETKNAVITNKIIKP